MDWKEKVARWVWVLIEPHVIKIMKGLFAYVSDLFASSVTKMKQRADEAKEKAQAAAEKEQDSAVTDPIEAAYQRGLKDALTEIQTIFHHDAQQMAIVAEAIKSKFADAQIAIKNAPDEVALPPSPPAPEGKGS